MIIVSYPIEKSMSFEIEIFPSHLEILVEESSFDVFSEERKHTDGGPWHMS